MAFLASLLFLTVFSGVELVNEVYQIPANDWRYVDLNLHGRRAIVSASFRVESGPGVRFMLMSRRDLDRMSRGQPYAALLDLPARGRGEIQQHVGAPWNYAIALENRGSPREARVHLRITLDFGDATQLSSERRLAVIAISFAVFFGVVSFSAIKLWRAANR